MVMTSHLRRYTLPHVQKHASELYALQLQHPNQEIGWGVFVWRIQDVFDFVQI